MTTNELVPPTIPDLLRAAKKDPRHPIYKVARENPRDTNITAIFSFSPVSNQEIGDAYGMSRERVRQIVMETAQKIIDHSSPQLKKKFIFEEISSKKPMSMRIKRKRSLVLGGRSIQAEKLIHHHGSNLETVKKIQKRLRATASDLSNIRKTLKGWGTELPFINRPPSHNRELARKLENAHDDGEISHLLTFVNAEFSRIDRAKHDRLLVSIKKTTQGFYLPNHQLFHFVEALDKANIPVAKISNNIKNGSQKGERTYYFIARQHLHRAQKIFRADPELVHFQKHPVSKVCGPSDHKLPSVYEILNKNHLASVGKLLRDLGIILGGPNPKFRAKNLLTADCPVDVFQYQDKLAYYTEDKQRLKEFLKQKHQELLKNI